VRPNRYALVLLGFGLQRLIELAYSLRNEARIRRTVPDAPTAAASSFRWMAAANVALFTLPFIEAVVRRPRVPRPLVVVGWVGSLSAVALRVSVLLALRDQWNVRALVPPTLHVVDRGPYRYVRHPNYLAVAIEFASLPLMGGAYASAVLLSLANALVLRQRIKEEELLLERVPGYRERMGGKPRFLPRLRVTARPAARPTPAG
jgi:methyltransferase